MAAISAQALLKIPLRRASCEIEVRPEEPVAEGREVCPRRRRSREADAEAAAQTSGSAPFFSAFLLRPRRRHVCAEVGGPAPWRGRGGFEAASREGGAGVCLPSLVRPAAGRTRPETVLGHPQDPSFARFLLSLSLRIYLFLRSGGGAGARERLGPEDTTPVPPTPRPRSPVLCKGTDAPECASSEPV